MYGQRTAPATCLHSRCSPPRRRTARTPRHRRRPTLTATLAGAGAQLSWTASTDNVGVSSYIVFQGASALVETTAQQYTTGALACGQTYLFGVEALDAAGNESGRGTATIQSAPCPAPAPAPTTADTNSPSTPGLLEVTNVTATSVSLGWAASTDDVGVTAYGLYENGARVYSVTGLTSSLTGLTCGTTYTVGVDAADAAGNRSSRSELATSTAPCPDTQAPMAPANLHATSVTQTSVALAWNSSTDNVGVVGYGIYWSGLKIGDVTDTSFVLTDLTCGTSTTVEVDAVDGSGNRSSRASLFASTSACPDTQAPSTPTGLQATSITQTSLTLSWNAATDNVGVTGYDVIRNGTKVATATGNSQSLTGLTCGATYTLGVEALDAAGNRSTRGTLTSSTSACPDTQAPTTPSGLQSSSVGATSLTLSWSPSSDNVGVTGYDVFHGGTRIATASAPRRHSLGLPAAQRTPSVSRLSTRQGTTRPAGPPPRPRAVVNYLLHPRRAARRFTSHRRVVTLPACGTPRIRPQVRWPALRSKEPSRRRSRETRSRWRLVPTLEGLPPTRQRRA